MRALVAVVIRSPLAPNVAESLPGRNVGGVAAPRQGTSAQQAMGYVKSAHQARLQEPKF